MYIFGNPSGRITIVCFYLAVFGKVMIKSGKHNILTGVKNSLWNKFLHCPYKQIVNFHPLFGVRKKSLLKLTVTFDIHTVYFFKKINLKAMKKASRV